eukprot:CAMPEP_0203756486 /NCGR_PEP_ID=MMETSP0098-20131031/9765_1 /ASSEMBLY_ACC=CAM_ASM_000208 /TAXON_ID=96639 /ORGANISM=" , Strain NY0313808BC1" /LENGTH=712 /DNA_ID=CAMNT_0050648391 /DNA_START=112 /DNA_END=2247 /DNA_ORIENTATION=-
MEKIAGSGECASRIEALMRELTPRGDGFVREQVPVDGFPGAFVVRGALSKEECSRLETAVRELHGEFLAGNPERGIRRESQHHIPVRVGQPCLEGLAKRLRCFLPKQAGPFCKSPLGKEGEELSNFLRTYCYQTGDFSAPHFDKSFHVLDKVTGGIKTFTAYSVVMYLNDGFKGGYTTFFEDDPTTVKSKRGNTPLIKNAANLKIAARVSPRCGDILIFPHGMQSGCYPDPLHEGSLITEGSKCIIRTDVVYNFWSKKKALQGTVPEAKKRKTQHGDEKLRLRMECMIRRRLDELCPALSQLAVGCVKFTGAPQHPELMSNIGNTLFWKTYRTMGFEGKPTIDSTVSLVSDYGLEKSYTRLKISQDIVDSFPSNHDLSFACVLQDGKIYLTSKAYAQQKYDQGFAMCAMCGKFVRAANGGLEWHMKNVHHVSSHSEAYVAVLKSSDAMIKRMEDPVQTAFTNTSLNNTDMTKAMEERDTLEDSISSGKIKSLGPGLDACRSGDLAALKECIVNGWDPKRSVDKHGSNGLLWAAGFGNIDIVKYLVEQCGMQPSTDIQQGRRGYRARSAVHWAARNGHKNILEWLVKDKHVPVDMRSSDGTTALCLAAWQGRTDICKFLIECCKADPHTVNSYGCNVAMWVSQSPTPSNLPLCKYFFSLGVDFSLINENGQGCLHKAAQRGNMDLCKWLLTEVNLSIEHFKPNAAEKSTPSQL